MNKTIPEMSGDARLLFERIATMQPNDQLDYAECSKIIGRDIKGCPHLLASARRKALRDLRIVTEAVVGVGIRRLADATIVETVGEMTRKRIRHMANNGVRKLTAVGFDGLTSEQKIKHNAELSQLSAVRAFSKENVTNRLESKIKTGGGASTGSAPLAIAKTLEVFSEK